MNVFGITEKSIGFLVGMFNRYNSDEKYIRKVLYKQNTHKMIGHGLKTNLKLKNLKKSNDS